MRSGSDDNAIRGNEFDSNGLRGILVSLGGGFEAPKDNVFTGNHATGNALFDVQDLTKGDGTQGTDSTYRGTRCATPRRNLRPLKTRTKAGLKARLYVLDW